MEPDALGLDAVRHGRLYEDVVRQIQELIAVGRLKPGDKLLPERELARRFQVSRGSVGAAMRTLHLMGLVRSRQGGGTVVCDVSAESLVAPLSNALANKQGLVAELLDVRKIIEPALAARAASHATLEEVATLEELLRRQSEKTRRGEAIIEEDSAFHYTIALAARNSVVRRIVDLMMDLLRERRARGMQVPGRAQLSLAGHRRIVTAIRRRDPRAAQSAMLRHLNEIEQIIMATQGRS